MTVSFCNDSGLSGSASADLVYGDNTKSVSSTIAVDDVHIVLGNGFSTAFNSDCFVLVLFRQFPVSKIFSIHFGFFAFILNRNGISMGVLL